MYTAYIFIKILISNFTDLQIYCVNNDSGLFQNFSMGGWGGRRFFPIRRVLLGCKYIVITSAEGRVPL